MASIHQKAQDGVWYIRYRQDGRQKNRSLETTSRRQALRLKREVELMLERDVHVELIPSDQPKTVRKNPDIDDFWEDFSAWAAIHRAPSTLDEYQNWFNQFRDFSGIKRLGDATRNHVENFKAHLLCQGKRKPRGQGLDKVSINNALKTLKSIWNQALKLGFYDGVNPFAGVEPFKLFQREERSYLDGLTIDNLLDAALEYAKEKYVKQAEARNVHLAIALMVFAGLRKGEVCYAKWEWLNWERQIMTVTNGENFVTKNRKNRVISLNSKLMDVLREHRQDFGYILIDVRNCVGKARYRADFKRSFNRVCELAKIQTTPHQLRHSFASRHAVAGTSLHVIAGWLGHSTTWVTQRYAHFQTTYNEAANNI